MRNLQCTITDMRKKVFAEVAKLAYEGGDYYTRLEKLPYELDIDLPGFKKDEVQVDLKDGYLTIQAAKGVDKDEGEQNGKYIRQERYAGSCSRSFYVGEDVEAGEVAAKFENGILQLSIPKKEHKQLPQNSTIQIQ